MKYKLLKQFDKDSIPVGDTFDMGDREYAVLDFDDSKISLKWLIKEGYIEPIREKKRYKDLKGGDRCYQINQWGESIDLPFVPGVCRSETFLTREEAEDEHKRREWAVRPDKFIPDIEEYYYCYNPRNPPFNTQYLKNRRDEMDTLIINSGLAFKSEIECREAIKEHDLVRLFYTIR